MNFWEVKSLEELDDMEWESLCDGCGQCCLHKLEDEDTGQVAVTNLACEFLDLSSCRCTCYNQRLNRVPECIDIRQYGHGAYRWLPTSCAYRLLTEGKPLPPWHPLLTARPESVHRAGRSVRTYAIQMALPDEALEGHVIGWLD